MTFSGNLREYNLDLLYLQILEAVARRQPVSISVLDAEEINLSYDRIYVRSTNLVALGLLRVSNGAPGRTGYYSLAPYLREEVIRNELVRAYELERARNQPELQQILHSLQQSVIEIAEIRRQQVELSQQELILLTNLVLRLDSWVRSGRVEKPSGGE